MILYEVLNEAHRVLAERAYCVWPDLEKLMREDRIPAFTVDGHRAIKAFDVLGISFSTELGYTNMLNTLDLAGIPLEASRRGLDDPVVVAGGHAAFNPEPISDFIDCAVLGDGEEAVLDITEVSARGRPRAGRAAATSCCCASRAAGRLRPALLRVDYLKDGRIQRRRANRPGVPFRVQKRTVMDLDSGPTRSSRSCRSPRRCTSG
jgi:radical SAM superfamily enzyme YgiQ (UPF0313 family)